MNVYGSRRTWHLIDVLLFCIILFFALPAFGQLQPVSGPAGFDWWPLIIVVIVGALIAGAILWHKRYPAGQAKALAEAHAALASVAHNALDLAHRAVDKLGPPANGPGAALAAPDGSGTAQPAANAAPIDPAPVVTVAGPTPDQLDAIASRLAEYNAARAAGGLPPVEG